MAAALRPRSLARDVAPAIDEIWADVANPKPFVNYVGAVTGTANYNAQSLMTSTSNIVLPR